MPAECLPGARGPGDASLAAGSRPRLSGPPCVRPQPRGRSVCWVLRCPSSLPARTPWAPAAAASWVLPNRALGRPQGPPLWDPACCCPRVSVSSWGGSVPPRASICDRSTLSSSAGRRRGGRGDAGSGGEKQGLCALSSPLCPWLQRGARRGRVSRGRLGAGVAGSPCQTARLSGVMSLPWSFQEAMSWPCSPPTSLERQTLFQKVLGGVLL